MPPVEENKRSLVWWPLFFRSMIKSAMCDHSVLASPGNEMESQLGLAMQIEMYTFQDECSNTYFLEAS
jgi:hypothetical protein